MMLTRDYQICRRCVMDTTASSIRFDEEGICHFCTEAREVLDHLASSVETQAKAFEAVLRLRRKKKKSEYDAVFGLSGGIDSSFLLVKLVEAGLSPLVVHLDNGWNSNLAVQNIERLVKRLKLDLYTHVLDWREFSALQVSFLKASVPDGEIPTDHAIIAALYQTADKFGIPLVIMGHNVQTESIHPPEWSRGHFDWKYIRRVHQKFSNVPLKSFPRLSYPRKLYYRFVRKITPMKAFNGVEYNRAEALKILEERYGFVPYDGKHNESTYTKFFQGHVLPTKFYIDKRRAHVSSLIVSGQISREEALREISHPAIDPGTLENDIAYVKKKLSLSDAEYREIWEAPVKSIADYPNSLRVERIFGKISYLLSRISRSDRHRWA